MTYFTARIRPHSVQLGYDEEGQLVRRDFERREFVEKVIRLDRILSFTDEYLFVACPHDTVEIWDYEGDLTSVKSYLKTAGLLVA